MKTAMNIFFSMLLGLALSHCSLFSKSTEEEPNEEIPQYDNYSSSGVYDDIQGEAGDNRKMSSEAYADDDYGDTAGEGESDESSSEDQLMLSGGDDEGEGEVSGSLSAPGTDPLPVEDEEPVQRPVRKAARKKVASVSKKFKNGMYRMSANCNMRKKPSANASKAGKVTKGKKLWVEGHNSNWVKVYKKSGAVYINKLCL